MLRRRYCRKNEEGSALVISVVFSLILALAGVGFLIVTTNSINKDTEAYNNLRAMHAAESGALMASKYLMPMHAATWPSTLPTEFSSIAINGCTVAVTIAKDPLDGTRLNVCSIARNSQGVIQKRVTITLKSG